VQTLKIADGFPAFATNKRQCSLQIYKARNGYSVVILVSMQATSHPNAPCAPPRRTHRRVQHHFHGPANVLAVPRSSATDGAQVSYFNLPPSGEAVLQCSP
jgi:hypothetical protein